MRLPRPLLLLVILLVVLAVAGGGVGLVGLGDEETDPRGGLTDFLDGLVPDPPPVVLDAGSAPCLSGDQLIIPPNGSCVIEVRATDNLRRRLVLRVSSGVAHFSVLQDVGGRTVGPQTDDVQPGKEASLAVSRGDSATLALSCFAGCVLDVNPPA